VLWLINRVAPSFKTIADFRKDHAKAIVGVCQAFVAFCRTQGAVWQRASGDRRHEDRRGCQPQAGDHAQERGQGERGVGAQDRRASGSNGRSDHEEGTQEAAVDVAKALAALKERREEIKRQSDELARNSLSQLVVSERDAS